MHVAIQLEIFLGLLKLIVTLTPIEQDRHCLLQDEPPSNTIGSEYTCMSPKDGLMNNKNEWLWVLLITVILVTFFLFYKQWSNVVCYEDPLLQYTTHLKQLYTSRSHLQPLSDSKHKHLIHFRLARIEKQTLSQGDMDRFTRESLRGDMDDVVYKKTAMESSELGVMPDGSQPKVVLIEGAPGSGKTTFAWQQCRQWQRASCCRLTPLCYCCPSETTTSDASPLFPTSFDTAEDM